MNPPRTVLALDLSTTRGAIAVLRGEEVLFEASFQSERSHNAQVFAPLGQALEAAGEQLDLIVIGTGPGSYTGVRIAIAAAQGVALSRGIPVIGWASIGAPQDGLKDFQVIGDARRGCFYIATVTGGQTNGTIEILEADVARARVEAGGDKTWLTFDAKVPMPLAGVQMEHPCAVSLARLVLALSEDEVKSRSELALEPVYLQDAFITTSKRAGKTPAL